MNNNNNNNNNNKCVLFINLPSLLPQVNVCSAEGRGKGIKGFGNITLERKKNQATDAIAEIFPSEEAVDSKKITRKCILRKNIENRSEMVSTALPEEELIANIEKRRETQELRYE